MTYAPDRRAVLAAALAAPLLPGTRLFAAPASSNRLLVVFLRGAYDCLSTLVPIGSSFYAEARPTLAVARPGSGANSAIALDGDWGLNPVLATSMLPFWKRGQLAFIPFAGTTDTTRSHFHTQDTLELGLAAMPPQGASGFLNRLAAEMSGSDPVAFTTQLPLIMRGPKTIPNLVLTPKTGAATDSRRNDQLARMYAADRSLGQAVAQDIATRAQVSQALATEMTTSGRQALGASDFEGVARRIGVVMRGKPNLGFVDVGGWDTHVAQAGSLNFKLATLGRGLAGFADAIGPQEWQRTTVVVVSEFGRTVRENGGGGTDHGRGTVFWVMGGGIKGGRIAGRQVRLARATLNEDRDLPVLNESRAVFAGLFKGLYGLDANRLGRVFPGVTPSDLKLV